MWQDIVISVGQWLLAIPLVQMRKEPPPLSASVPTAAVLMVFAFTFSTLNLTSSTLSSAICGCMWLVLSALRVRRERHELV